MPARPRASLPRHAFPAPGALLHRHVVCCIEVDRIMFGRSIAPAGYCLDAALTFAFSAAVNLAMYRGVARIDMISPLKSVERPCVNRPPGRLRGAGGG